MRKLGGKSVSDKILSQIIPAFKAGRRIGDYHKLWDTMKKYNLNLESFEFLKSTDIRINNHIGNSECLSNKKSLLYHMQLYAKIFN